MKTKYLIAITFAASLACTARAGNPITYTDWTTASSPGVNATAGGTLSLSTGTVDVTYSGEFNVAQINNTGTQYWTQPNSASLPYTGNSVVGNAPSTTDIIELAEPNGLEVNTITFSQPVFDPIMLINSLGGGSSVSYVFNQSFTLLSAGQGYWGGNSTTLTASGDTLTGTEGAGAIEFMGEVSSISWETGGIYGGENWNGFTIGAETSQPTPGVPDGGTTLSLMGMSLAGLLGLRRMK
jgi:hypothetical protein